MSEVKRELTPNMLWVCIDQCESSSFSGRIYSIMQEKELAFHGFVEFVLEADKLFDNIGFPQAFQKKRSFKEENELGTFSLLNRKPIIHSDVVSGHNGDIATFIIVVESRQHSEWQGKLLSTDFKLIQQFPDILDLSNVILEEIR